MNETTRNGLARCGWGLAIALVVGASTAQHAAGQADAARLPSVALPAELQRVLTDYENAWQRRDPAGLAALFAEDGFVLPSRRPPIRGRAAIQQYYEGHGGALSLRALAFAAEGPVGYIIGAYAPAAGEPDSGKFTLTLRRDARGRWLIMSDMDNGNR